MRSCGFPKEIDLGGKDWRFREFNLEDKASDFKAYRKNIDTSQWFAGEVPGNVQSDLLANRIIPHPYYGRNSYLCEWVSNKQWVYRKEFFLKGKWQGSTIRLFFEGVDYSAKVYLNEDFLGKHKGMYAPFEFEVSEKVRLGKKNILTVIIDLAPEEIPQFGRTSDVKTHKSRVCYGWDFSTRLIPVGIWQNVKLLITGDIYLTDC